MTGSVGMIVAGVAGAVLAALASIGIVNAVNGSPSPVDKSIVNYGSATS